MEYIEGNYYEMIDENHKQHIVRFVGKKDKNVYEYFNLLTKEVKKYRFEGKDLLKSNPGTEIEYLKSLPFGKLTITTCRISEIKNPTKGKNIFDDFIKGFNSFLHLNFYESEDKYYLEFTNIGKHFLENNINVFFNRMGELAEVTLSQEIKDNFLIK